MLGKGDIRPVEAVFSLGILGLVAYIAVHKHHNGARMASVIGWFVWTVLWVGAVIALVGASFGVTWGVLGYLGYAAAQVNAIVQRKRADESFTSQYGGLTWNRVTYLGGHPEFRTAGVKGVVLISQAGVVLVDRYRANARTLFMIPIDRILRVGSTRATNKVIAWSDGVPIPMTFTSSEEGMLTLQFANDLNDTSTASFRVGNGELAAYLKNQVDYALYDWKRASTGGLHST